jgi:hypothetical protein
MKIVLASSMLAVLLGVSPALAIDRANQASNTEEFHVIAVVSGSQALTDQELASIQGQAPIGQIGLVNVAANVLDRANVDVRVMRDVDIRNVQVGVLAAQRQ